MPPSFCGTEMVLMAIAKNRNDMARVGRCGADDCEEVLGFQLAWRTADGTLAALASDDIELFLLVLWTGNSPIQPRTAYIYVEDPDALCAEYQQAGAGTLRTFLPRGLPR